MRSRSLFLLLLSILMCSCASAEKTESERTVVKTKTVKEEGSHNVVPELSAKCAEGNEKYCYSAGIHYFKGKSVKKNLAKALSFFTKACRQKYVKGCYAAGMMYYSGKGTERDCDMADELFSLGCERDHSPSCAKLWECSRNYPEDDYEDGFEEE